MRYFLTLMVATGFLLASDAAPTATAANGQTSVQIPNLEQTLRVKLRPRTPAENAFLSKIVGMGDAGDLPLSLVQSTFLWSLKRPLDNRFQYFAHGLRLRAKRLGIVI